MTGKDCEKPTNKKVKKFKSEEEELKYLIKAKKFDEIKVD